MLTLLFSNQEYLNSPMPPFEQRLIMSLSSTFVSLLDQYRESGISDDQLHLMHQISQSLLAKFSGSE